jgi:hypothetical protein
VPGQLQDLVHRQAGQRRQTFVTKLPGQKTCQQNVWEQYGGEAVLTREQRVHTPRGEDGTGHDYDLGRQKRSACVLQLERGDSGRKTLLNKDMK